MDMINVNALKAANPHVPDVETHTKNYQRLSASMSAKLRLLHVCDMYDGCIVSMEQFRFLDDAQLSGAESTDPVECE
jgi:hypothetical protein